jgi:hypothetical protein
LDDRFDPLNFRFSELDRHLGLIALQREALHRGDRGSQFRLRCSLWLRRIKNFIELRTMPGRSTQRSDR